MLLGARLYKTLRKDLDPREDVFVSFDLLQITNELFHIGLTPRQRHLTGHIPEIIGTRLGTRQRHLSGLAFELVGRDLVEGEIRQTRVARHREGLHEVQIPEFREHIVGGEHPFSIRQTTEFLHHLHVIHEVDITLSGDRHLTAFDQPRGISHDIEVATEAEVLCVVRKEMQMEAFVSVHIERIYDIVAIKGDGPIADRTGEVILQETDLVIIDVNVSEDILQDLVDDITRLDDMVDTLGAGAQDDGLLTTRILTVNFLGDGLVKGEGQHHLAIIRRGLNLIHQPTHLLVPRVLHPLLRDVIEGKSQLLVFLVLIVVVITEVGAFLGGNDLSHHCHCRIVLPAIAAALGLDGHLLQQFIVGFHRHVADTLHIGVHHHGCRHKSHGTERQHPTMMTGDGVMSVNIRDHTDTMPLILDRDRRHSLSRAFIGHVTPDHLLSVCRQTNKQQKPYKQVFHPHDLILSGNGTLFH